MTTKAKLRRFETAIERAQAAFQAEIEKLAEAARAEILPYFQKRRLTFTAGNGTWFISKPSADTASFYRPDDYVDNDELPKNIRDLLWLEVARADHLGFYIRDIKRGE